MIYMEMPTTNTRTASAESVSAKFVSSAWKSRYGGDSSSDPYFMGARRHDFDAGAVAPAFYPVSSKSRRTHEGTLVRLSPPPLAVNKRRGVCPRLDLNRLKGQELPDRRLTRAAVGRSPRDRQKRLLLYL